MGKILLIFRGVMHALWRNYVIVDSSTIVGTFIELRSGLNGALRAGAWLEVK